MRQTRQNENYGLFAFLWVFIAVATASQATAQTQYNNASFIGNQTSVPVPSGQMFVLARQPDCSLTYVTATYSVGNSSITYNSTGYTLNYEKILHDQARLTTAAGIFSGGCTDPMVGVGSSRGVSLGKTTSGIEVYASVNYNGIYGTNVLNVLTGTILSYKLTTYSFSDAYTLTTADLNKDGNGDLIVTQPYAGGTGKVYVLLGNADGTFQTAVPYATSGGRSMAAAIDDINGDGKLDIVSSSDDAKISVLIGNGDGTFQSSQSFTTPSTIGSNTLLPLTNIITSDINKDGKKDIIASNGLVFLGNGSGGFTAISTAAFPSIYGQTSDGPNLAVGDINKDGNPDIALSTGNRVLTYLGTGDGTFSPGRAYTTVDSNGFVTITDLDGDGNEDIYIGYANGGYFFDKEPGYALMGNGDGTFVGAPALPAGYNGTNLGDINNDGIADLIVINNNSINTATTFTAYLGMASGGFVPASTIALPASINVNGTTYSTAYTTLGNFAVADINGDRKADLVFTITGIYDYANTGQPFYFVALSNGDGTFQTPVAKSFDKVSPDGSFDADAKVTGFHLADIDNDGKVDLQVSYSLAFYQSQTRYLMGFLILPGNGDGTFGAQKVVTTYNDTASPVSGYPNVAKILDLNGDKKLDLVSVTTTGGPATGFGTQAQIFLNNNTDGFSFNAATAPSTAVNPIGKDISAPMAFADLNGDGKLDLVLLGETSYSATPSATAQMSISLGNGDGTFGTAKIYSLSGGDSIISGGLAVADFNSDGKLDIAINSGSLFANGIFFGNGDGTFQSITASSTYSTPTELIYLAVNGPSLAQDFNGDGKIDLLAGSTLLLSLYGTTPVTPPANTVTSLSSSATSVITNGSATLTAAVTSSSGTPNGSVVFFEGSNSLGSASLDATGKATYNITGFSSGSHTYTAAYQGNTTYASSTSAAVSITASAVIASSTSLTSSATTAVSGTSITFTAAVAPTSGTSTPAGTITLYDGTTSLGSNALDATGKAAFSTVSLATGTHSITARYSGSTSLSPSISSAVTVTITTPVAADFALALAPTSGTIAHGSTATTTTTLTPAGGFRSATILTCTGAPSNSTCSISASSFTPDGSNPSTANVTIRTDVSPTASTPRPRAQSGSLQYATLGIGGVLLLAFTRRRRLPALLLLGFVATSLITACGGSSTSATPSALTTPAGTYIITITGTSGSLTHNAQYTLTVQ